VDYIVVMRDFNAVMGEGKEDVYVGHYGLRYGNDRGQMLVDYCKRRHTHTEIYTHTSLIPGLLRTEDIDTCG